MADRGEAGEVSIEGGHLATVFERDGGDDGVGHQVSQRISLLAEPTQHRKVAPPGPDEKVVRLTTGGLDEVRERR